jgi:hypothetical protein
LANLFPHYALDRCLARQFPAVSLERYADDAVLHCASKAEAETVLAALKDRMAQVGLKLHSDKTRIVYCKDGTRRGWHEQERLIFLGYTFRPRLAKSKHGNLFLSFLPTVSDDAKKTIGQEIPLWRINRRSDKTIDDLARSINPIVQGWINYRGRFYKSGLYPLLKRINEYLLR